MILQERNNFVSSEFRILTQLAVLPTGKPFAGGNPKSPVPRREQASNISAGELLTRRRLPWDGSNAIEGKQTKFRAQPEVSVGRLSN